MQKKHILDPDQKNEAAGDRGKKEKAIFQIKGSRSDNTPQGPGEKASSDADRSDAPKTTDQVRSPLKRFDKIDVSSRLINMVLDMSLPSQLKLLKELDKSGYERARKYVRKPYVLVVDCETEDMFFQEYIKDISAGGLFLRSQRPMVLGQEVRITFQLPHHEKIFHVLGRVARISRDGVGIRFIRQEQLKPKRAEKEDNDV